MGDIVLMARRLAVAVADPTPKISKAALEAVLFGPTRWSECFIAVENRVALGYAMASRCFEAHTGKRQLRIADLFVDESARGSGVGNAIFLALIKRAKRLRCHELVWDVWKANTPAYAFYERLGAHHVNEVSAMRLDV